MKQRIMNHVAFFNSIVYTGYFFCRQCGYVSKKYNSYMRQDVKVQSRYLRYVLEYMGEEYLTQKAADITSSRVTIFQEDGTVAFDSKTDVSSMENHKDCPGSQSCPKREVGKWCGYQ